MRKFGEGETRSQQLERTVHTVISELLSDHGEAIVDKVYNEDILDCVSGMVGPLTLDEEASVFLMIERMR